MKNFTLLTLSLGVLLLTAQPILAQEEAVVAKDKTVSLDYTLTIHENVVETSEGKAPLVYVHGQQAIVPGLEKQLVGMKVGEEKELIVSPEEGYGPVNPNSFIWYNKNKFTEKVPLVVGQMIQVPTKADDLIPAAIIDVRENFVLLNFNHPLAGFELKFNVKIVSIK